MDRGQLEEALRTEERYNENNKSATVAVTCRLPTEVREALAAIAAERGKGKSSVAAELRRAAYGYLRAHRRKAEKQQAEKPAAPERQTGPS